MPITMLVMFVAFLGVVLGVGLVGFLLGRSQLSPPSAPPQDRRLAQQADRIDSLEDELQRVKDQADFTERLLSERGGAQPGDAPEGDPD